MDESGDVWSTWMPDLEEWKANRDYAWNPPRTTLPPVEPPIVEAANQTKGTTTGNDSIKTFPLINQNLPSDNNSDYVDSDDSSGDDH